MGSFHSHLIGKISVMDPPNCPRGCDYGPFVRSPSRAPGLRSSVAVPAMFTMCPISLHEYYTFDYRMLQALPEILNNMG